MKGNASLKGIVKGRELFLERALLLPRGSKVEVTVEFPPSKKRTKNSHRHTVQWIIQFAEKRTPLKKKDKKDWDEIIEVVYKSRTSAPTKFFS